MDPETMNFFSELMKTAPVAAVCIAALWIVSKRLFKSHDDHVSAYKDRIVALENKVDECDRDRADLHAKYDTMQNEVVKSLTRAIETRFSKEA